MAKTTIMTGYDLPPVSAGRTSRALLFAALLAPPAAWFLQLCVDYGVTSMACFPRQAPLPPGWNRLPEAWSGSLALNLAALAIACIATGVSWWIWRRARHTAPGEDAGLAEAGEGRTRFLAVWGIWTGVWFAIDILFNTIAVFEVGTCGS